jgi:hypothetical protein
MHKPPRIREEVTFRKLKAIPLDIFTADLASCVSLTSPGTDLEEMVDVYNRELSAIVDKHAPKSTRMVTLRPHAPWFTDEIRQAKQEKRKWERRWRKSKLEVDREIYRQHCQHQAALTITTKEAFYVDRINQCGRDAKAVFRITDHLLGKPNHVTLPDHTSKHDLAESFSSYFSSKVEDIRQTIDRPLDGADPEMLNEDQFVGLSLTSFSPATEEEVAHLIQRSPSKSCELDPIPTWLLKKVAALLVPLITAIINKSLETSTVPAAFKRALVRPLLKKPGLDSNVYKNYRPVSNLSFLSKILEKVVCRRIEEHLNRNTLLDDHQSAYRSHASTETALTRVNNDILLALDKGHHAALILLDLSAAFDTIDHDIFLHRAQHTLGIRDGANDWLRSYFTGRSQAVALAEVVSSDASLKYGVPQGSVLGPKGFCMYTLPLGAILRKHNMAYMTYADDTQAYITITNESQWNDTAAAIAMCFADIKIWMNSNFLRLNEDKTDFIVFTSKNRSRPQQQFQLQLGSTLLQPSEHVRNLGIVQDNALTMERQINSVTKSGYYHLRRIAKIRKSIPKETCKALVQATVISRLDYCNGIYIGLPRTLTDRLQRVQNAAARVISGARRNAHITPVLKDLHQLPIVHRVQYKVLLLTFKAMRGCSPGYMEEMVVPYQPGTIGRRLRSSSQTLLQVPRVKTKSYGERTFTYAATKLWNGLPEELRSTETLFVFKKKLKTFLFTNAFNCDTIS